MWMSLVKVVSAGRSETAGSIVMLSFQAEIIVSYHKAHNPHLLQIITDKKAEILVKWLVRLSILFCGEGGGRERVED